MSTSESSTAASTPGSVGVGKIGKEIYSGNDHIWTDQNGPKKRGPKPKNEPAATVALF